MKTYKVAQIVLTSDGVWMAYYQGDTPQGFGPTNFGMNDLDSVLHILNKQLTKHKDKYIDKIEGKERDE